MDAPCVDPALRARLLAIPDPWRRGCETLFAANYYPTRFTARVSPLAVRAVRARRLDLPVAAGRYDGIELAGR